MKVAISQKVLLRAIEKGGMAALSEKAQADSSNRSKLVKSIHIKIGDELTISSASSIIASKFSLPASKDNGIDIKEKGEAVIPAKEFFDWVSCQLPSSQIGLILKKLDTPELINVVDSDKAEDSDKNAIRRLGTLNITSRDQSKTGVKWALDSYDPEQLPSLVPVLELGDNATKLFTTKVENLKMAVSHVKFSAEKIHYQHLYDSISFYGFNGELFALATDRARCATYKIDKFKDLNLPDKVLIPANYLSQFTNMIEDGDDVTIYYDEAKNKVFVSTPDFIIRLSTADKALWNKIPSIKILEDKQYSDLGTIPKSLLASRLITMTMVTKGAALFVLKNDAMVIWAKSESSPSPMIANSPITGLLKDTDIAIQVSHILSCIKMVKDEDIQFGIPENDQESILIRSTEDPNFKYYIMSVNKDKLVAMREQS